MQCSKQGCFSRRFRRVRVAGTLSIDNQLTRLEGIPVDLSGGQARHFGKRFEVARNHVRRQGGCKCGTQRTAGNLHPAFEHQVGNQLIDAILLPQDDGHRAHPGLVSQRSLDLAKLHPKTSDLDLVIGAAQALHLAIGIDAGQVTRAVQALVIGMTRPGIGQELFCGQVRPTQVSRRQTGPRDAQLPDLAARHQLQAAFNRRTDDQQAIVGQRTSDGYGLGRLQHGQTGRHRGLGRTIGIEYLAARHCPAHDQRLGAHLAAQVDQAQARHVPIEECQQGRYRVQHGDRVIDQRQRQGLRVRGDVLGCNPQRGACQVADPYFLERHVEGDREPLVDTVLLVNPQDRIFTAQEVANAALGDFDALGLAGRSGGVDDIGGV